MNPPDPLDALWDALVLSGRLMVPFALALVAAAGVGGVLRRLLGDDPGLSAALRLLAVIVVIAAAGAAIGEAIIDFARWSWGGG